MASYVNICIVFAKFSSNVRARRYQFIIFSHLNFCLEMLKIQRTTLARSTSKCNEQVQKTYYQDCSELIASGHRKYHFSVSVCLIPGKLRNLLQYKKTLLFASSKLNSKIFCIPNYILCLYSFCKETETLELSFATILNYGKNGRYYSKFYCKIMLTLTWL